MDLRDELRYAGMRTAEEGREEGLREGREEGLREGAAEERKAGNLRFLKILMEDGRSFEEACRRLGLTEEETACCAGQLQKEQTVTEKNA